MLRNVDYIKLEVMERGDWSPSLESWSWDRMETEKR